MSLLDNLPSFLTGGGSGGGGSGGGSGGGLNSQIINQNTLISANEVNGVGSLSFITDGINVMTITPLQKVGINTSEPQLRLEVNDENGRCVRLTFNDPLGRSINYTDLNVKSDGSLDLKPSSGSIYLPHNTLTSGLYIGNELVTASALQLNSLNVFTFGIAQPDKALILDDSGNIEGINNLSSTNISAINLYGTLLTGDQPGITKLGSLLSLTLKNDFILDDTNGNIFSITSTNGLYNINSSSYLTPSLLTVNNNLYITSENIGIGTSQPNLKLSVADTYGHCFRLTNILSASNSDFLVDPSGNLTIESKSVRISYNYNNTNINFPLIVNANDNTGAFSMNQGLGSGIKFTLNDINFGTLSIQKDQNNNNDGILSIGLIRNNTFINNIMTLTSSGSLTTAEVYEYSDVRIKKNIKLMDTGYLLDKIMNVNIKSFTINNKKTVGVIAQELKELLPDLVQITNQNNIKNFHSVKTNGLIFYLIGAIQHIYKKLESLEN